jgi:HK97 gp10 family phage protein
MADGVSFKLEGAEELGIRLKGLSNDLQYKGGRFALRKAANIIRDAAKEGASRLDDRETAEKIAENIVVRWSTRTFRANGDLKFRVGVLGGARQDSQAFRDIGVLKGAGKQNPGGDTFYWRFLEFGTENIAATPFMRPALSKSAGSVQREFITQYNKALDRYLAKKAR